MVVDVQRLPHQVRSAIFEMGGGGTDPSIPLRYLIRSVLARWRQPHMTERATTKSPDDFDHRKSISQVSLLGKLTTALDKV